MNNETIIQGKKLDEWINEYPIIDKIARGEEGIWLNSYKLATEEALKTAELTRADVKVLLLSSFN